MWTSHSYTDTGKIRKINEDSILDFSAQNIWLVADGMGGHSNGDYASQLVANTFRHFSTSAHAGISKARIIAALDYCNTQLIQKAENDRVDIIGCTVALLHARANSILCSWSGDSRIYRLRNDALTQLTQDHSQGSTIDDRDLLRFPTVNFEPSQILTGAIGGSTTLAVEHCWYRLIEGDNFLICTDGLNKEVSDEEIHRILNENNNGEDVLETLVALYQGRGARDNIGLVFASYHA